MGVQRNHASPPRTVLLFSWGVGTSAAHFVQPAELLLQDTHLRENQDEPGCWRSNGTEYYLKTDVLPLVFNASTSETSAPFTRHVPLWSKTHFLNLLIRVVVAVCFKMIDLWGKLYAVLNHFLIERFVTTASWHVSNVYRILAHLSGYSDQKYFGIYLGF